MANFHHRAGVRPWVLLAIAVFAQAAAAQTPRLELRQGDRIVLLGNTLAERMQHFNHFETLLMTRFPELQLRVRNLGWSGDTITLQPRPLNFGDASKHLHEQKADVIFAFFGLNESFEGAAGLARFEQELDAYLQTHLAARYNGTTAPRLVLVSPLPHEWHARLRQVDVDARNRELGRYTAAMARVAERNQVLFVNLFTAAGNAFTVNSGPRHTLNGIFGRELATRLPAAEGQRVTSTLDQLVVRVIRIEEVAIRREHALHPILRGITPFRARSWLYHVAPLHGDNRVLLDGTSIDSERADRAAEFPLTQPVAWTREFRGARVFFTTLGHPKDFEHESMRRLLVNAIYWGLGREVPDRGTDARVQGTYVAPEPFDLSKVGP